MDMSQTPGATPPCTVVPQHAPFLLHDPQTVWVIRGGSIGLFTVPVKDGAIVGARHYLGSLGPGEALFGVAPAPGEGRGLLAVPFEDTELVRMPWGALREQFTADHAGVTALVEGWIGKLDATLPRVSLNRGAYAGGSGAEIHPPEGGEPTARAAHPPLVHPRQGQPRLDGVRRLTPGRRAGSVAARPWHVGGSDGRRRTRNRADRRDSGCDTLLAGVERLQRLLLRYEALDAQQQADTDRQRLHARQQRNQQMRETVLSELAAVLQPQDQAFLPRTAPLCWWRRGP